MCKNMNKSPIAPYFFDTLLKKGYCTRLKWTTQAALPALLLLNPLRSTLKSG